jgi:hypothetical protein
MSPWNKHGPIQFNCLLTFSFVGIYKPQLRSNLSLAELITEGMKEMLLTLGAYQCLVFIRTGRSKNLDPFPLSGKVRSHITRMTRSLRPRIIRN